MKYDRVCRSNITPRQKKLLVKAAQASHQTVSEYIRNRLFGHWGNVRFTKSEYQQAVDQLQVLLKNSGGLNTKLNEIVSLLIDYVNGHKTTPKERNALQGINTNLIKMNSLLAKYSSNIQELKGPIYKELHIPYSH